VSDNGPTTPGTGPRPLCVVGVCGLIWVEGPDAASFLHGLVTCDVSGLAVGEGHLALLLDARGHITAALQIVRDDTSSFTVITEAEAAAGLFADLERFHFSEDLVLLGPEEAATVTTDPGAAVALDGVRAPGWMPGTVTVVVDDPLSAAARLAVPPADIGETERLRIRAGVPRIGIDTGPKTLVQEALLTDRVVDFTKGCYLGQETVARAQHRGQVNKLLRGLVAERPLPPGGEVHDHDRAIGTVTSVAADPELGVIALGILRRDVPDGAAVTVGPDAVPATVCPLPLA
jgi:tRNA-modifying protein YgfZ